jgi:hypothetical protein
MHVYMLNKGEKGRKKKKKKRDTLSVRTRRDLCERRECARAGRRLRPPTVSGRTSSAAPAEPDPDTEPESISSATCTSPPHSLHKYMLRIIERYLRSEASWLTKNYLELPRVCRLRLHLQTLPLHRVTACSLYLSIRKACAPSVRTDDDNHLKGY